MDKLNTYSQGRFSFLRLAAVNVLLKSKAVEFCFVVPEEKYDDAVADSRQIQLAVEKAAETELTVLVVIKKSHFDPQFFIRDLIKFFDYYASFGGCICKRDVTFDFDAAAATHKVTVALKESAYQMFCSRGLLRELTEFVDSNYCENIQVSVVKSEADEVFDMDDDYFSYEDDGGRRIFVNNAEGLVGYTIYDPACYICDAAPAEQAVLCGKVGALREIVRKSKVDGRSNSYGQKGDNSQTVETDKNQNGKEKNQDDTNSDLAATKQKPNFFKFELNDSTGIINCLYFATEKTIDKFRAVIKDGTEVIALGKLEPNAYEGGALNFYIRRLSLCGLPKDFKINRLKRNLPKRYKNVFPKKYIEYAQTDLFSSLNGDSALINDVVLDSDITDAEHKTGVEVPKILEENEFVVFDIETTGLDRLNDKIIEIGAVKIKNGVLTETFSCFIDPCIAIPEKITKLTGITDADLKDALLPAEILPDFYKFTDGAVLVGHNLEFFDFPFLAHAAAKEKIYFDNKRLDTWVMAKENLTLEQYGLQNLVTHFGITNNNAHRALSDAVATAKVFIELCKGSLIKPITIK